MPVYRLIHARARAFVSRTLRFIFTPSMRFYRRFAGATLLEARLAEQIRALAAEVRSIQGRAPDALLINQDTSVITEGLRTSYLLSEKLDMLHAEASSQQAAATESLRTSYFLATKLDLLHADLQSALQKIDRLEGELHALPLEACSEKLDLLLQARSADYINNHTSREIDRLDGYLLYHVEQLKADLVDARNDSLSKSNVVPLSGHRPSNGAGLENTVSLVAVTPSA